MPTDYLAQYPTKQLNQIVFPGSHDAGIYGLDKGNVKTQELNIGQQADVGVRWFDMRIATMKKGIGPSATYEQRSYHLDGSLVVNDRHLIRKHLPGGNKDVKSHQNVSHLGGFGGDKLEQMLGQAKTFVETNGSEFLIMKFSKCFNLENVVESCLQVLGNTQFKSRTMCNLNTKKVGDLAGKVITLFDSKALSKLNLDNRTGKYDGCFRFRELYDKESESPRVYDKDYDGLQYYGKFSSTNKIATNTEKQKELMLAGAACDPNAMGMMYWTTTGLIANIENRNTKMWRGPNRQALKDTWACGLKKSIEDQVGRDMPTKGSLGSRTTWKFFMPNIVMMDFATSGRCGTVWRLNNVTNNEINDLVQTGLLT